ncbi:MAG: 2-oxoacid:ferredoxin oxidoreductase subunit beta [Bdellovibrionales bacterium]|nr:2-oxoacid:ferredoxin oxidoreductase subunit beta [Bdellovibrionales bacterium]
MSDTLVQLTKKDFESNQEVRWCPGCGDYSILAGVQRTLASMGVPKEQHVFISGIGCASRFPYYMNTYGFHTIHGRAPAIATGLRITNPDLTVWLVTGDGDALSIGGNHFIHILRRNVNVNILLFNNRIYGLTKGQYSPTSQVGKVTKSTPYGSIDEPIDPIALALAAKGTYVARASAVDVKLLSSLLESAAAHNGTSVIEIFQNCPVFNDGVFDDFVGRKVKDSQQIEVKDGEPLFFGAEKEKGIALDGLTPKVVDRTDKNFLDKVIQYNSKDKFLASLIAQLPYPQFPVPVGVLYQEERAVYEDALHQQIATTIEKKGVGNMQKLLFGSNSWTVREGEGTSSN